MKKLIAAILLLSIILTGCSKTAPAPTDPQASENTTPSVTDPTDSAPGKSLMDGRTPVGSDGVMWEIHSDAVSSTPFSNAPIVFCDSLLLVNSDGDGEHSRAAEGDSLCHLTLIDIMTGDLKAEADMPYRESFHVQACNGKIAFNSIGDGTLTLLDGLLHTVQQIQTADSWANTFVDSSCHFAYSMLSDGTMQKMDLANRKKETLFSGASNLYLSGDSAGTLTVCYQKVGQTANCQSAVNMATGEISDMPFPGNYPAASCVNGLWFTESQGQSGKYLVGRGNQPASFVSNNAIFSLTEGPAPLYSVAYLDNGSQDIRLYKEDGSLFAACQYPAECGALSAFSWSALKNGYFVSASTPEGKTKLLFLDASKTPQGGSLDMGTSADGNNHGTAVPDELYSRADAISKKYGIEILIADQCHSDSGNLKVDQELDPRVISRGAGYPGKSTLRLSQGLLPAAQLRLFSECADSPDRQTA